MPSLAKDVKLAFEGVMTKVNIHEAKTHLSKLIEKAKNGEEVVIALAPVVVVAPPPPNSGSAVG